MTDIAKAILAIKSDAQVSIDNEDINKITWHDGNPTNITNEQILAKQTELKTAYDNKKYQRDRLTEYPPIGDQLDMLWHSIDESPELKTKYFKFYEACKAIKVKYPK